MNFLINYLYHAPTSEFFLSARKNAFIFTLLSPDGAVETNRSTRNNLFFHNAHVPFPDQLSGPRIKEWPGGCKKTAREGLGPRPATKK